MNQQTLYSIRERLHFDHPLPWSYRHGDGSSLEFKAFFGFNQRTLPLEAPEVRVRQKNDFLPLPIVIEKLSREF